MKTLCLLLTFFCTTTMQLYAQSCGDKSCFGADACYEASQIKSQTYSYALVSNVFKSATASQVLQMTVYSPDALPAAPTQIKQSAKNCKRPFIMLIHGGGFSSGCRSFMEDDCIEFARRGYVAATIDYRTGWLPGDNSLVCKKFCASYACLGFLLNNCNSAYSDSLSFAIYRSVQDADAAMRFITHFATYLNIDVNALYVGGSSAGSITALNLTYMNQREFNLAMPGVSDVLGKIRASGNPLKDSYKIAGVFNNWGSLPDTAYIKGSDNKIPMIAFHGIDDPTVPYGKDYPMSCTNGAYGTTCGSKAIYEKLVNQYPGMPVELYACYGKHGIFESDPATDPKSLYRLQKAICFFKRVREGDNTQKLVEVDEDETLLSYNELDSISPVNCSYSSLAAALNKNSNLQNNTYNIHKSKIYISPNPAQSKATLFLNTGVSAVNVVMIDMQGRPLWKKEGVLQSQIELPIANLSSGLYMVIVGNDKHSEVIKFSKID